MKPLGKLRIEKALQSPHRPNSALLWLETSQEAERELRQVWEEKIEGPATDRLLALVNMGADKKDIQAFRQVLPAAYDISRESDSDLVSLRDELRGFWDELAKERSWAGPTGNPGDNTKVALALHGWWKRYDLESDGYVIFWETGTFFPSQKNFRAVIARVLFNKRRYLAKCPLCEQYFIKRRDDQKICLGLKCKRKANTQRQTRHHQKNSK